MKVFIRLGRATGLTIDGHKPQGSWSVGERMDGEGGQEFTDCVVDGKRILGFKMNVKDDEFWDGTDPTRITLYTEDGAFEGSVNVSYDVERIPILNAELG